MKRFHLGGANVLHDFDYKEELETEYEEGSSSCKEFRMAVKISGTYIILKTLATLPMSVSIIRLTRSAMKEQLTPCERPSSVLTTSD